MAARLDPATRAPSPSLVDLRHLRSEDLDVLLDEEVETWRRLLDWDFAKSADLVRRFVDMRALNGFALVEDGEVFGYAYYVLEEHKGLIGDLFVREAFASAENESRLLASVLEAVTAAPQVVRIESQLMMWHAASALPLARQLSSFERNFMMLEMPHAALDPAWRWTRPLALGANRVYIERWADQYQEPASQLIAAAYQGHVDSLINDQYRSIAGARRFLFNIVQYPGCGTFYKPASVAAFDRLTGRICGICLASLVMPYCGHITQICVAPAARGEGVGRELLRQSLSLLRQAGCRKTSLTVTASNREAIRLYEDLGFMTTRRFFAYVWEGF
ncbi:MAG TPA: N-acetyltransferase [Bryobacteraceae bacterium]|jgi:ribosomal protein S18 acetylase RimI-like enzyme|nr:N-acetyltransferase [Bryobacteraceae bacterium]